MVNMELNIFKLKEDANLNEIIEKIEEKEKNIYKYQNLSKDIEINKKTYKLKFFFYMNENVGAIVNWYTEISKLFGNEEVVRKKIYSGYGIWLIYCDYFKYAITFGRATNVLNKYIDWDFGLEMASKMLNKDSINAQSSKFFSTIKNKSLIVYNKGRFDTEVGESVDLINATISEIYGRNTINRLSKYINPKVGFSSSVKIVVSVENIDIRNIVDIIILLNKIYKEYINRINIPKLIYIKSKDQIIEKLKNKLNSEILSDTDMMNVSISMYSIIDSEITLMNNITKYKLIYNRKGKEYNVLNIEDIKQFMLENEIKDVEDINLKVFFNDTSKKLKVLKIIDYTTEIEDENAYFCLYDGRWAKFNIDYINKVNQMIEIINDTIVSYDSTYDLSCKELEEIKNEYSKEISEKMKSGGTGEVIGNLYREFVYNFKICKEKNGLLLDRKKYNQIEICDMYIDKELIHTKIGSPGEFNECINQSIKGFETWNYNKAELKKNLEIEEVECVTLLLITNNKSVINNKDISQYRSVRFKLNLIDWQRQVQEHEKKAKIIIAQLKD